MALNFRNRNKQKFSSMISPVPFRPFLFKILRVDQVLNRHDWIPSRMRRRGGWFSGREIVRWRDWVFQMRNFLRWFRILLLKIFYFSFLTKILVKTNKRLKKCGKRFFEPFLPINKLLRLTPLTLFSQNEHFLTRGRKILIKLEQKFWNFLC